MALTCLLTAVCGATFVAQAQTKEIGSMSLPELYRQGMSLVGGGQYQAAIPYLKEFLTAITKVEDEKNRPLIEQTMVQLAIAYLESQQLGPALETLEQLLSKYPETGQRVPALLLLAETRAASEEWDKVIETVASLQAGKFPLSPAEKLAANQLLGESLVRLERWADGVAPWLAVYRLARDEAARTDAAAQVTVCMVRAERFTELFQFLPEVFQSTARYDVKLNLTLIESGDHNYQQGHYEPALLLYRLVYSKAELVVQLERRLKATQSYLDNLVKNVGTDRGRLIAAKRKAERLLQRYQEEQQVLAEQPEYVQGLTLRMAQTYVQLRRYWEAVLLFRSVFDQYPQHEFAERALYSAFSTAIEMENQPRALREGYDYVAAFPGGEFYDIVTLTLVQMHIEREEFAEGLKLGLQAVEVHPKHEMIDQMTYLLGFCSFNLEKFDDARKYFQQVMQQYPDSFFVEPAEYWHATAQLFSQHYTEARQEFEAFLNKRSGGSYFEDASYRLGVAQYGEGDFEASESTLRGFVMAFPKSLLAADALNMMGDIQGSWGHLDAAIALYQEAISKAPTMIGVNYGTFQMARVYELKQRYDDIITLFRTYLTERGTNANFTEAYYWIGNAQMQQRKPAEALDTFFEAIVKYGNVPKNYGIDFILRDVAYEQSGRIGPEELNRFLDRLRGELTRASARKEATLELRLTTLFAETQKDGDVRRKLVDALLRENNIKPASPLTLMVMGREAMARGDQALARKVYDHFFAQYDDSDMAAEILPTAAELEILQGRLEAAIAHLQAMVARFASTDEAGGAQKRLGDVYRMQKKYDAAIEAYTTVLGVRDWKGPLWPESLYLLGICEQERGRDAEAFAYFQRVYVLYQAFPEWMAKAYLKSAECLVKLGKPREAIATYEEMLKQEQLSGRPELATAREALQRLGGQS